RTLRHAAVAQPEEHPPAVHHRRPPRRQRQLLAVRVAAPHHPARRLAHPDLRAGVGVQTGDGRAAAAGVLVDAAADVTPTARRRRIDVQVQLLRPFTLGKVPYPGALDRVHAVNAVIAGAEVDPAAGHHRRRLGVTFCAEVPQLLAGLRVEAVEAAAPVLVEPLADVEPAVRQARAAEDLLHLPAVVEL